MTDTIEWIIAAIALSVWFVFWICWFVFWVWRQRVRGEEDLEAKLERLARSYERQLCADEAYRAVLKHSTVQLAEYVRQRVMERE